MPPVGQPSDRDRVRDAIDLVQLVGEHVALKSRGREFVGLCPFHDDRNPSFAVVTHKGNAFYKCHACGAAGDCFRFVMDYHKVTFGEALRMLAERAGITLQRTRTKSDKADEPSARSTLLSINATAAEFYRSILRSPKHGKAARETIDRRGLSDEVVEEFMLGAAPDRWDGLILYARQAQISERTLLEAGLIKQRTGGDGNYDAFRNRLIFPICDELGRPIAFGGRQLDPEDKPKYLNSPESAVFDKSSTLYGLHLAKREIMQTGRAIITEGYLDVIACHQFGVRDVVATLGTALTPAHARVLKRFCQTVIVLFDGDKAGQDAADRAVEVFFAEPVDVRICVLPGGVDPDDLLRKDDGLDCFNELIEGATDALAFKVERFRQQLAQAQGLSARQVALERFLQELTRLGFNRMPGVRKQLVLNQIADLLRIPVHTIEAAIPKARPEPSTTVSYEHAPQSSSSEGTPDNGMAQTLLSVDADVPRKRLAAERELIGLALVHPEIVSRFVTAEGNTGPLALSGLADASFYRDLDTAEIGVAVFSRMLTGRPCLVQHILDDFSDAPERRTAVVRIHGQAQQRWSGGSEEAVLEGWRRCVQTLADLTDEEMYRATLKRIREQNAGDPANIQSLDALIQSRRKRRYNPQGLMKGAR